MKRAVLKSRSASIKVKRKAILSEHAAERIAFFICFFDLCIGIMSMNASDTI